MTSKRSTWGDLETDSASPEVGHVGQKTAAPRRKETGTARKQQTCAINIVHDEWELCQASCEKLQPQSLSVEQNPPLTKLDSNIQRADPDLFYTDQTKEPFHLDTPSATFAKVVQENLRLKRHCRDLMSNKGKTMTITLDNEDYEDILTRLKLELEEVRTLLKMKENTPKDAFTEKIDELQKEKMKLSKSVVAKASLLSIYNKEYERLKQENIQLQQQLSEKHIVGADTGKSFGWHSGDGNEVSPDVELQELRAKHALEIEQLNTENKSLQVENNKLQRLNKTYEESNDELLRTCRTVKEQLVTMEKELKKLCVEKESYADNIRGYSRKIDEMKLQMKTEDAKRLKQMKYFDEQTIQFNKLAAENTELQRQLDEVTRHNSQLKYQINRSPQTSTESPSPSPVLKGQSFGEGIVVADGIGDDEEKFICLRCERKFSDQKKFAAHMKKCNDS